MRSRTENGPRVFDARTVLIVTIGNPRQDLWGRPHLLSLEREGYYSGSIAICQPNRGIFSQHFIYSNSLHITRLDVAFNDHTGILDIERIAQDTQEQRFVSRMKYWEVVRSSGGTSCQIGSPKSKVFVRIYDKAAERGFTDSRCWVHVELQLRDKRAEEFLKIPMRIGEAFAGVLLNYLRFVEPDISDSNKSRWKMTDYWAALVSDIGRIKIFTVPGGAYNAEKCRYYVFDVAGNAIDAILQMCDSVDDFLVRLYTRRCRPTPSRPAERAQGPTSRQRRRSRPHRPETLE